MLEQASLGILLVAVISVGAFAYSLLAPVSQPPFTDFYLLNAQGGTETYRVQRPIVDDVIFVVGIVNGEGSTQAYSLVAKFEGKQVAQWGPIELEDQMTWNEPVVIPREKLLADTNQRGQLEFFLYPVPESEIPFGRVYTWIDPSPG